MSSAHFQNPASASSEQIRSVIESGRTPVLQFAEPPDRSVLERVDAFCREFGPSLQIRFYSFGWREFDTSLLDSLPNVANLSIDTIRRISDFSLVAKLPKLTRLRFGVHEHPDGNFLRQLDLPRFTHLTLAENRRRNFDLSPLSAATSLEHLFIQGHQRGIEAISELPHLSEVSLSGFPKRHDLTFLNDLAALRSLLLILGSRASIAEFTHAGLRKLSIIWVRLLADLGPLQRFTSLEELTIEDQLQLTRLDIGGLNLRRLDISNCKRLSEIAGLQIQGRLEHLSISRTAMPGLRRTPAISPPSPPG